MILGDDDRDWTAKLKARNKAEREANVDQLAFDFGPETLDVETTQFSKAARDADAGTAGTLARMRARADAWRKLETDPDLVAAKRVADAWCAAFVQPKKNAPGTAGSVRCRTHEDAGRVPAPQQPASPSCRADAQDDRRRLGPDSADSCSASFLAVRIVVGRCQF